MLVIDMPPGTGDVQLTMAQQVPLSGAVIVSTPQDLALIDARKGLAMFRKVDVPVLGIVENMSYFRLPQVRRALRHLRPRRRRGRSREARRALPRRVPLDMEIRARSDDGQPITATEPDSAARANLPRHRRARLGGVASRRRRYAAKPPKLGLSPDGDDADGRVRLRRRTVQLSAEMLRVMSPSAEVQGHSPEQRVTVGRKRNVKIKELRPVGNYAMRIAFDDGHDTGLFTWTYLQQLGREKRQALARVSGRARSQGPVARLRQCGLGRQFIEFAVRLTDPRAPAQAARAWVRARSYP